MQIPGIEMFPIMPPALPGGGFMPVEFYICSTAEPERILELAEQLKMRAMQAGVFRFPPPIDTKIDQPESQIVIDHDKVAMLGHGRSRSAIRVGRSSYRSGAET